MRMVLGAFIAAWWASVASGFAQPGPGGNQLPRDEPVAHASQWLRAQRDADRMAASSPESPAAIHALLLAGRRREAVDVFERIINARSEAIEAAIREIQRYGSSSDPFETQGRELQARVDALVQDGLAAMAAQPAERRAERAANAALTQYARLPYEQRLAALERVSREEAGTPLGWRAESWRIEILAGERPLRGPNDYSTQLSTACEAVERLASLPGMAPEVSDGALRAVLQVSLPSRSSGTDRPDDARLVAIMRGFVLRNRTLLEHPRLADTFRYLAFSVIPEALEVVGNAGDVAGYFAEWSRHLGADLAALAEADYGLDRAFERLLDRRRYDAASVASATDTARRQLRRAMERAQEPTRQRAHGALAAAEFRAGRVREARALLDAYVDRYPDSGWGWMAAMHAAQATQVLETPAAAAVRFGTVARRYADQPTVPTIATFYQGRAFEADGRMAEALEAYERVLRTWEGDRQTWSGLDWPVEFESFGPVYSTWPREIERAWIAARIEILQRARTEVEGLTRVQARWLLDHAQPAEARDALRAAVTRRPDLSGDPDFATLRHRAEHDAAIAAAHKGGTARRTAVRDLTTLCREPFDSWVGLGCAALASIQAVDGREKEAIATFSQALAEWQRWRARAVSASPPPAPGSLEDDAIAIRDLLFQPRGGGPHGARRFTTRENGDLPPFLLLPSELRVTLNEQPGQIVVLAARQPPGLTNAVFLNGMETKTLWETAESLSGCEGQRMTRHAQLFRSVVGWAPAYCVAAGEWLTVPIVGRVNFVNAERTRAEVPVEQGGGGILMVVEKPGGAWRFHSVTSSWVY